MNKMTKLLALLLALALLCALSACSGDGSIDHTWHYQMDFQKAIAASGTSESFEELGELGGQMDDMLSKMVEGVTMDIILELKSDNSYKFYTDEDSAKAAAESMVENISKALPEILASMLGIEVDDVTTVMSSFGFSTDSLVESIRNEMDMDQMLEGLKQSTVKGSYRYEEGRLYLTPDGKTEDPDSYLTVELEGKELRIVSVTGTIEGFEKFEQMLPIVFTR